MNSGKGIVYIDMHIRDQRILDWIRERAAQNGGVAQIRQEDIANRFECHINTACAIVKRLTQAGYIRQEGAKRGGYYYRVANDQQARNRY